MAAVQLATKQDLKRFATKQEFKGFQEDFKRLLEEAVQRCVTKERFESFQVAVKEEFDFVRNEIGILKTNDSQMQTTLNDVKGQISYLQGQMSHLHETTNTILHHVQKSSKLEPRVDKLEADVGVLKIAFKQNFKSKGRKSL